MRSRVLLAAASLVAWSACAAPSASAPAGADLRLGDTVVATYVHAPYDPSDVRTTCKVWHELRTADGRVLTKGTGGQFEHHRGLFFGFNRTTDAGRALDFWHCNHGETQRHVAFVDPRELSLGSEWTASSIDWCDAEGKPVVHEVRALRVRDLGAGCLAFDATSELRSDRRVRLGGDPQHSGHQFRALDRYSPEGAPKVRYVRPAAMQDRGNDVWTGGDWVAAILPFPAEEGGPVTVVRVEGKGNPEPVQWSTRDYGRFGATFARDLAPGEPLRLWWHYVVSPGELDAERCARLAAGAREADR